ncbi:MAG: hypothetical protein A2Y66_06470 [Nitrospirae bacterium RBG_13_41_22]|nr:MAG: hypothetical protein A2Y66_06470 [Nitrospirae bacterium RBG_13_41_22]OHE57172.1 MAG: hypothetical protein A2Z47_00290 [Thermodesulfovibrio sp. RBG_19FT_COMBO_42_12]
MGKRRGSRSQIMVSIGLMLTATVLSLIAIEVGIRLFAPQPKYYQPRYLFTANAELGYAMTPHFKGVLQTPESRTTILINSQGLRDHEHSRKGKITIMGLGDSFTFGSGVETKETFLWKVEELLNKNHGDRYAVIKAGVPGYGTDQEYAFLKAEESTYEPSLVVLGFYVNDIMDNVTPDFTVIDGYLVPNEKLIDNFESRSLSWKQRISRLLNQWETMLFVVNRLSSLPSFRKLFLEYTIKAKGEKGNRMPLYGVQYTKEVEGAWHATMEYLRSFKRMVEDRHARLLIVYIPERQQVDMDQWKRIMAYYKLDEGLYDIMKPNTLLIDFCRKEGILFLDLTNAMRKAMDEGNEPYFTMDAHLTRKGHEVTAETIYREILGKRLIHPLR